MAALSRLVIDSKGDLADFDLEFKVLSFSYQGEISQPYSLSLATYCQNSDQSLLVRKLAMHRAVFRLSDKGLDAFQFSGVIYEVQTVYNESLKRDEYHFELGPAHRALAQETAHCVYAQTSLPDVIRNVVTQSPVGINMHYADANFHCFKHQQSGHYNQILQGNILDFFHYQLNLHGFYYPCFDD